MIFSSAPFFAFFAAVLALYAMARSARQRAALLLAASIVFYASWRPIYLLLLFASLGVNYAVYNRLLRQRSRAILITGVALNLIVLGTCKYLHFALESVLWIGNRFGWAGDATVPAWINWALPLGISFYTFHMLSALIDVYRGDWAKRVSFARWCLYVTFFPHLIAGPILRPGQLIDQLGDLEPIESGNLRLGAAIFVAGLVKKVLFADNLATLVDRLYAQPDDLGFTTAWVATLAFAFQIYFDFSGYSEMAIGLARAFGVSLPRNFLYPYLSRSPSEFWRRWHVTLSRWLRDYLYIPLGGSRGTRFRINVNLLVTMLLGGLWHGANWTFVFWGLLHGVWLVAGRLWTRLREQMGMADDSRAGHVVAVVSLPVTFVLVSFTWVFFRAARFEDAWKISGAMLGFADPAKAIAFVRLYEIFVVGAAAALVFAEPRLAEVAEARGIRQWWRMPFPLRGLAYFALALVLIVFGGRTQKFIYFDF
jgi:D-alanyl-lipoteichoic acid acyltransferase DltB (MBOAT superfamily)